MKVFISQPMADKTDERIKKEREAAANIIKEMYPDEEVEIIDSFFEGAPYDAKPLWFLGESFKKLADANIAVFVGSWREYRGCRMEFEAANEYGIETYDIPYESLLDQCNNQ